MKKKKHFSLRDILNWGTGRMDDSDTGWEEDVAEGVAPTYEPIDEEDSGEKCSVVHGHM